MKLETNKWLPIKEYYENLKELDWTLVQFKEKSGFMGLPHIAEYRNTKKGYKWFLQNDDNNSYYHYINEDCEAVAFMLWESYEEELTNGK